MSGAKFNPEVTKIKLNPEQAVLSCTCYASNVKWSGSARYSNPTAAVADMCIDKSELRGVKDCNDGFTGPVGWEFAGDSQTS